jgi:hypothetical protein
MRTEMVEPFTEFWKTKGIKNWRKIESFVLDILLLRYI